MCYFDGLTYPAFLQLLPSTQIAKIMNEVLVGEVKIDNSVRDSIQNSVASFILHLTGEACTKCDREGRKSITGDDILWSVDRLGFKDYEPVLRTFLRRHRAIECEERMRKRQAGEAGPGATAAFSQRPMQAIVIEGSEERPLKRR